MPFQKGQSGNPTGRPLGARGRASLLAEEMFTDEAHAIIRVAIEKAKEGDMTAVRLCLSRVAPRLKDRAINFELPPLDSAADAASAVAAIITAVAAGDITPAEAGELFKLVEGFTRTLELTSFEERLTRLECKFGMRASMPRPEDDAGEPAQESQSGAKALA